MNRFAHGTILVCSLFSAWAIAGLFIPPLQDLPDHVARASLLRNSFAPSIQQYFRFVAFPTPYMGSDYLMALLLWVFDVPLAAKLFSLGAAAAMIGGAAFFLRRVLPGRPELVLACFALLFSKVFAKGNLNFLYGLGLLFLILGFWWPRRNNLEQKHLVILGLFSFLLYVVHLVDLFAWVCILSLSILWMLKNREPGRWQNLVLLFVPAGLMGAYLLLWKGAGASDPPLRIADVFAMSNIWTKPANLREMFTLVSADDFYYFLPAAGAYLVSLYFSFRSKNFSAGLPAAALLLFWVVISPYHLPGLIRVYERFFFVFIVWSLGMMQWSAQTPRIFRSIWILAMAFTCVTTAYRYQSFAAEVDPYMQEYYETLGAIPEGSLACPIKFGNPYVGSMGIFLHIDKYAVAQSRSVLPNMIQAKYMLFRYKQNLPLPPQRPTITEEMAATYNYFIVFGKSAEIDARQASGELIPVKEGQWLALYRNAGRKVAPLQPFPSAQ